MSDKTTDNDMRALPVHQVSPAILKPAPVYRAESVTSANRWLYQAGMAQVERAKS